MQHGFLGQHIKHVLQLPPLDRHLLLKLVINRIFSPSTLDHGSVCYRSKGPRVFKLSDFLGAQSGVYLFQSLDQAAAAEISIRAEADTIYVDVA